MEKLEKLEKSWSIYDSLHILKYERLQLPDHRPGVERKDFEGARRKAGRQGEVTDSVHFAWQAETRFQVKQGGFRGNKVLGETGWFQVETRWFQGKQGGFK